MITNCAPFSRSGCWAIWMHRSGPMPAGSPGVTASVKFIMPDSIDILDVGFVANFQHPVFQFEIELAAAQGILRLLATVLSAQILFTTIGYLGYVPAKAGAERLTDLSDVQVANHGLELGGHAAVADPTQLTTGNHRHGVVGMLAGEHIETLAIDNTLIDILDQSAGLLFSTDFIRRDQNMARLSLMHQAVGVATHVGQADNVEAVGAANGLIDLAGTHVRHNVGEQAGQLIRLAPAQFTAGDRHAATGCGLLSLHTHFGEIFAALDAFINFVGKGFFGLLQGWAVTGRNR